MGSVRSAVIYSSFARFAMKIIGLVSSMLVARLLTPSEIGTYAVASSIVMIMVEFRLLGAGSFLIREKELTEEKVRSALGITLIVSWGLGFIILGSSVFVTDYFGVEGLFGIFCILSTTFFFAPYISIPIALLSKQMAFKAQLYIRLCSSIVGVVITITLIFNDFSFYSLAIGQASALIFQFFILTIYRPEGMVYMPSFKGLAKVAKFGAYNSVSLVIKKASVTVPDIIIGKMGSTAEVGMFSRGVGFIEFVSQTIVMGVQPVALPFLSKTLKEGGDVKRAYIKSSVMLAAIVVPILGVASLASLPAIRLFFGDQWDLAAPVAAWIAIWSIFRTLHWFSNDVLVTVGKENLMLVKEVIPFTLLCFLIASAYSSGLEQIALSFVLVGFIDFILTSVILFYSINLSPIDFIKSWWSVGVIFIVCWLSTKLVELYIPFDSTSPWLVMLALLAVLPIVWFVTLMLCKNPLYFEIKSLVMRKSKTS